jgi:predicted HAD superfamily Cof-like phosphohydrolase
VASPQQTVQEFHESFRLPIDEFLPDEDLVRLRMRLLKEEHKEVREELEKFLRRKGDRGALAKELADLLYVTYGCAIVLGLDLDEAFRRVHESNMSKLDEDGQPVFDEGGKVLKGPNYFEPTMDATVTRLIEHDVELA